jgi:hypothetical protein
MATYFAQADGDIDTATLWDDAAGGGGGGTDLTWASLANGDVLVANGHTIAVNVDVGADAVRVVLTTVGNGGTDGGVFNVTATRTIYADIIAGTTTCLAVSGTGTFILVAATSIGIKGTTVTSADGKFGLVYTSSGAFDITANITGGSGTNIYNCVGLGKSTTHSGTCYIRGNIAGGTGGWGACSGANLGGNGASVIIGNITSGTVSGSNIGVNNYSSSPMQVTGNIIHNTNCQALTGKVIFTPAATNYIQYPYESGGTAYKYGKTYSADDIIEGATADGANAPAAGVYHKTLVGEVLDSVSFGPGSVQSGTYHEATEAEVQAGVTFGAASALTGTYAGGGGGGVLSGGLVD